MRHALLLRLSLALTILFTGFELFNPQHALSDDQDEIKTLINRRIDAWNAGDTEALYDILAQGYVYHEDTVDDKVKLNRDNYVASLSGMKTAYPDFTFSITDFINQDDRAVTVWRFEGTQSGPLGNLPVTGKRVRISGVLISRIANGKIVEEWSYHDQLSVFMQLGYTLGPSQETASAGEGNGKVIINDVVLPDTQISTIEEMYGVKPLPGKYWYDTRSGLYGVAGYPAYGFMHAGHEWGVLKREVSKGNSNVIVNGRELPQSEWAVWSQVLGYWIQPGAYWFDKDGNAGYEGNPMPVVNLYAAAQQNAYRGGGGGGDNFWSSRFGAGNSDSGGQRGYVSVPGHGPIGYGF